MLINEFNRFKDIDNKFNQLMKNVAQNPFVLAVLEIPQIEENLDKWVKHLNAIKKALGDYLEKQRQSFARFYFVGDDDLLEIIGNSKEIKSVQRHFPKMFAGITTVTSTEEGDKILGMISREGEQVGFSTSVNIVDEPAIYKWLAKVESTMQVSLATLLDKALQQLIAIDRNEEPDSFNEWIVNYPA
jgi:dynein heavy chain 1